MEMVKGAYHRFHCDHIVNQLIHAPNEKLVVCSPAALPHSAAPALAYY